MSTGIVVLLGVIALGSAVQTGFVVWLALSGLRVGRWARERQDEVGGQLARASGNIERVRRNVVEVKGIYDREYERTSRAARRISARARHTREDLEPVVENVRTAISLWRTGRDAWRGLKAERP